MRREEPIVSEDLLTRDGKPRSVSVSAVGLRYSSRFHTLAIPASESYSIRSSPGARRIQCARGPGTLELEAHHATAALQGQQCAVLGAPRRVHNRSPLTDEPHARRDIDADLLVVPGSHDDGEITRLPVLEIAPDRSDPGIVGRA